MTGTVLYFLRHGETDWNVAGRLQGEQDIPLNAQGRRQATACGEILRDLLAHDGHAPTALPYVASPLIRARETMELMRAALGLPVASYRTDPRLREVGFGQWEGFTWRELRRTVPAAVAARERDKWRFVPPDGESYAQMAQRMGEWQASLQGNTVAVAHGGTARALLVLFGDATPEAAPQVDIGQGVVYRFTASGVSRHG
jgi:broad specificity phosphatase PhoE